MNILQPRPQAHSKLFKCKLHALPTFQHVILKSWEWAWGQGQSIYTCMLYSTEASTHASKNLCIMCTLHAHQVLAIYSPTENLPKHVVHRSTLYQFRNIFHILSSTSLYMYQSRASLIERHSYCIQSYYSYMQTTENGSESYAMSATCTFGR